MIYINRGIQILFNDTIIVPHTEAGSSITAPILYAEWKKSGLENPVIINVNDALALIPGSKVVIPFGGTRAERMYMLPDEPQAACDGVCSGPDYFKILRDGGRQLNDTETEDLCKKCCEWMANSLNGCNNQTVDIYGVDTVNTSNLPSF